MEQHAGRQVEPTRASRSLPDRRHEDIQSENVSLRKMLDALAARVVVLESRPEPWLDKGGVAAHHATSTRTVEKWIGEGMPMPMLDGRRKGQLSKIQPWLEVRGYVPPSTGGTVSIHRARRPRSGRQARDVGRPRLPRH